MSLSLLDGPQDLNDLEDFRTRIGMCLNGVSSRMYTGKSRFKESFKKFGLNITWFHLLTMTKKDSYFNEFPAKCVIHIFFARFFTYLGNILLKTIHMKTWTLILTSYSKMMVRDIFHFRKVQASTMGLIFLWMSILKCIHLHFMIIFFFVAAMWKRWFKAPSMTF